MSNVIGQAIPEMEARELLPEWKEDMLVTLAKEPAG
jgi:hypothetical protein